MHPLLCIYDMFQNWKTCCGHGGEKWWYMCHVEVNTLKYGPFQVLKVERGQNFGEEGMFKDKCVCEGPLSVSPETQTWGELAEYT